MWQVLLGSLRAVRTSLGSHVGTPSCSPVLWDLHCSGSTRGGPRTEKREGRQATQTPHLSLPWRAKLHCWL